MRHLSRFALCGAGSILALLGPSPASGAEPGLELPTYTRAYEPRTVDERGVWMEADEAERGLRDSPLRIREAGLEAYLREVLCREVGTERCAGVRIYAMEIPGFNASMMANGTMQVWSGLLLRSRSEAELAAVLGHEFAHFELRHSLTGFQQRRRATDAIAWIGVWGALTNRDTSSTQSIIERGIYRYGREQETDADLLGLQYAALSGYPASTPSEVWKNLMAEEDASAAGRNQKPKQKYTAGYFDSHPTHLKRSIYLAEAAAKMPPGGDARAKEYRAAMAPICRASWPRRSSATISEAPNISCSRSRRIPAGDRICSSPAPNSTARAATHATCRWPPNIIARPAPPDIWGPNWIATWGWRCSATDKRTKGASR
ncbi:M48 family metallopeptidase [Rhizorhabdus histidinilytica]